MFTTNWTEFAETYCERYKQTPAGLLKQLGEKIEMFHPTGFMILECQQMDSSHLGEYALLPFGPNNTFKEPPTHPVSPRGLASDMSTVKMCILTVDLPL